MDKLEKIEGEHLPGVKLKENDLGKLDPLSDERREKVKEAMLHAWNSYVTYAWGQDELQVTCQLLGVILEETTPEELQKHATVRSSVLEVLLEITKFCDVYLMERILDDESEEKVLSALSDAGVFTTGGLVKDKVLCCSTENGRISFVRQLEPDWHIDTNPEIIHQLARFIKYQLHISPSRVERAASNVFSSASLEQFFGGLGS